MMQVVQYSPTTNLIAAYDNERDALALVFSSIERNGPHGMDTLMLEVEVRVDVHSPACSRHA